jgi:hypothetical protein
VAPGTDFQDSLKRCNSTVERGWVSKKEERKETKWKERDKRGDLVEVFVRVERREQLGKRISIVWRAGKVEVAVTPCNKASKAEQWVTVSTTCPCPVGPVLVKRVKV